jgi:hypothetical protein
VEDFNPVLPEDTTELPSRFETRWPLEPDREDLNIFRQGVPDFLK